MFMFFEIHKDVEAVVRFAILSGMRDLAIKWGSKIHEVPCGGR